MCVRFGPMTPIIPGTPLIMWHPRHVPAPTMSLAPFAGSPLPNRLSSNLRPDGYGVLGTASSAICSRGKAMNPAWSTWAGACAATGCAGAAVLGLAAEAVVAGGGEPAAAGTGAGGG